VSSWSTTSGGGSNPAAIPGASDVATFHATSVTTSQTIDTGNRSAQGLNFTSSQGTILRGTNTNTETLTLGSSGIAKSGTGAVQIGNVSGRPLRIALSANQTWSNNNNTGAITIGSANESVTSNAAGARTLTLGGTSTAANTVNSVISNGSGEVSVIKSGTGTWRLGAANTHTGDTTVNGGTLVLGDGAAIPSSGKLVISGGRVNPSGNTVTIGTLFFGGTQQAAGTWGSSSSTATNKNNTHFTGTGVVSVTAGPGSTLPGAGPLKLLFSSKQDLFNVLGEVDISVTPSGWINRNAPESPMNSRTLSPIRYPVACFPQGNGSWVVFSQQWETVTPAWPSTNRWSLMRGTTTDGVTFSNVETVIPATQGTWTNHLTIAYNPDAGEYMMLKMDIDPRGTSPNDSNGFVYHSWFSSDGRQWVKHTGNRPRGGIFYEADAVSSFWSPVLKRFVVVSKSIQPWPAKRIIDHAGQNRRVLMIRSSPDGRNWTPDGDLKNIYELNPASPDDPHPDAWYTVPDANDAPDLEFYSGTAFWYYDRAYMMVLNYAASPMFPGKHGEELDNEWWTSPDGLNWERPARDENAHAAFMDGKKRIDMPPLVIDGKLQWTLGRNENSTDVVIAGLPEDRISGASARVNGEFSTKLFKMPNGDLRLNAAVPSPDRPWVKRSPQPYLQIEVLNSQGSVISGFERDKFVIWDKTTSPTRNTQVDATDMPLVWNGKSARQLAGQNIRLRFYFGGSTVYAITTTN
jgi:autotransporter-associated beta strand protein